MFRRAIALAPAALNRPANRGMATIKSLQNFTKSANTKATIRAALIELSPPTPAELPKAFSDFRRIFIKANWRQVPMREAWLNALVTCEVVCWFFVGECIGKGSLIGYQV